MKKIFAVLIVCMSVFVTACGAQKEGSEETTKPSTISEEPAKKEINISPVGAYEYTYKEELEGTEYEFSEYIVLEEEHTGFIISQDSVAINWDADKKIIYYFDDRYTFEYDENSLTVDMNGNKTTYLRLKGDLPVELTDAIKAAKEQEMASAMEFYSDQKDFSGNYYNGNEDSITLSLRADKYYDVTFSAFRLCQMEGEGNWVDGGIEIMFEDPSGKPMAAVFFEDDNESYTLRITQSEWQYIEAGKDFEGFIPAGGDGQLIGMANPWTETDEAGFLQGTGFYMNVPEGAENVSYSVMNPDRLGQITFTLNGVDFTARIKSSAEFEDISGMYYDWTVETDGKVGWNDAKCCRYIGDGEMVDLCLWYDIAPGVMYSLSAQAPDLDGFDILAIAEQVYEPMQDDVG